MSGPPKKKAPKAPVPAPSAAPVLCFAKALHNYAADGDTELSLTGGEIISVLQKDADWWRGTGAHGMGWFPSSFVEEQSDVGLATAPAVPIRDNKFGGAGRGAAMTSSQQPAVGDMRVKGPTTAQQQLKVMSDKVVGGLKQLYRTHIRPVEELYKFGEFHSPCLEDSDFDAPPMVLMLGQYSVGKTSFIKYLLERDFPGQRIGPEPTTDRFVAVMHGQAEKVTPGNAAAMDAQRPFRALNRFGSGFLSKFEVAQCPSPILKDIYFVDTPGVLSGEKQRIGRSYDFASLIEWFATRADRILLLFDAHKLDISDEFRRSIQMLKGHDDKIRVVLNKSDQISNQQLMRVYGAMMWSLGKVVQSPEVLRVYVSSFWDRPYADAGKSNASLFDAERNDLMADLRSLPRNSAIRKINELIKRARLSKVHALLMSHLRSKMPSLFGKEKAQQKLLENIVDEFYAVQRTNGLSPGDFPNVNKFREIVTQGGYQFNQFPALKQKLIDAMDHVLSVDVPALMKGMPLLDAMEARSKTQGNAGSNPFGKDGISAPGSGWAVNEALKAEYQNIFVGLESSGGRAGGAACQPAMVRRANNQFDNSVLGQIWDLADIDKDGCLDGDEFAVAMYLIDEAKRGNFPGDTLPDEVIPPTKRKNQRW
jgi:EH domain-containing protein 1